MKVPPKIFLEALEKYEGEKTNQEIAAILGVSEQTFYILRRKHKDKIAKAVPEYAKQIALRITRRLEAIAMSKDTGNVAAAKKLLEMAQESNNPGDGTTAGAWVITVKRKEDDGEMNG